MTRATLLNKAVNCKTKNEFKALTSNLTLKQDFNLLMDLRKYNAKNK